MESYHIIIDQTSSRQIPLIPMHPNYNPNNPNRNIPNNGNQQPIYLPYNQQTSQNPNNYSMGFSVPNQRPQLFDPKFQEFRNQKMKNAMYSSTMEFNKPVNKVFTSLQSMGRFVPGQNDKFEQEQKMRPQLRQQNTFEARSVKTQMASSTIFTNEGSKQLDRFPMFDLHASKKTPVTKVESKSEFNDVKDSQTPEQRRKRQLEEIKRQFQQINRKVSQMGSRPKTFEQTKNGNATLEKSGTSGFPNFLKKNPPTQLLTEDKHNRFTSKYQSKPEFLQPKREPQENFNFQSLLKQSNQKTQIPVIDTKYQDFFVYSNQQIRKPINFKQEQLKASISTNYSYTQSEKGNSQMVFKKKTGPLTIEDYFFDQKKGQEKSQKPEIQLIKKKQSVKIQKSDFITVKKLGKGQFGQVTLVQHKTTGFLCGLKVMAKKQIRDQKYAGQIARELSIQFFLSHRNIASLYGYFQDADNFYLLLEFCPDGQLLQKLRKERRMQEQDVSLIIRQILQGMNHIHMQYIIHRDIKPENILFSYDVVKICDFGWAVYRGQGMRKTASGSPLYYSPEIVNGDEYDQKIDIWDIGMMTYQCLLGKIPFKIYSQMDLKRIVTDQVQFPDYVDVTQQAKDFILRTLKKKPEDRMQIREMLRHPFITKYRDRKLPIEVMQDLTKTLN